MDELKFLTIDELRKELKFVFGGVYLIQDSKEKIVYIGKASDLRKRINHHFSGLSANTAVYARFFRKVAYIIDESPLNRAFLEMKLIVDHKPILNKEIQEEFPEMIAQYLKENEDFYKIFDNFKKDEVKTIEKTASRMKRDTKYKEKKDLVNSVGGRGIFNDILFLLDMGYNYHFLAESMRIDKNIMAKIRETRSQYNLPKSYKRNINPKDLMYTYTGNKTKDSDRLNHLL